jgi:hypothetical protein
MKFGLFLPGTPTVIDQIVANKPDYEQALRHGDRTFAETGTAGPQAHGGIRGGSPHQATQLHRYGSGGLP